QICRALRRVKSMASSREAKRSARMNLCSFNSPLISLEMIPQVWNWPASVNGAATMVKPLCSTGSAAGSSLGDDPPPNSFFQNDIAQLHVLNSRHLYAQSGPAETASGAEIGR